MENKRIDLVFAILIIAFLAVNILLSRESNARKIKGYQESTVILNTIIRQKDIKIKLLYNQLVKTVTENKDLKSTLSDTRNDLESLSKKLAQPVQVAVPVAPAAATTPASAPAALPSAAQVKP